MSLVALILTVFAVCCRCVGFWDIRSGPAHRSRCSWKFFSNYLDIVCRRLYIVWNFVGVGRCMVRHQLIQHAVPPPLPYLSVLFNDSFFNDSRSTLWNLHWGFSDSTLYTLVYRNCCLFTSTFNNRYIIKSPYIQALLAFNCTRWLNPIKAWGLTLFNINFVIFW